MRLTETQIVDIIKNNPAKATIKKAVDYNTKMRMHLYGDDLSKNISLVDGFEKDNMKAIRAKYAKSNKDLFSRLSRPIDKVFSARGGSAYYNMNDANDKRAMGLTMNVRDGYSAKKWIESFWKPHMLDDPNGVIFIEIGDGNPYPLGVAYPTYKSITSIYDYATKGVMLDYIVFKLDDNDKKKAGYKPEDIIFRVVDDVNDYLVKQEQNEVTILKSDTIPNYFSIVPAIINSDVVSADTGLFISLFDEVVELANDFLLDGSIKRMMKFRHGFPKYWEYSDSCADCKGEGTVNGEKCNTCKGTGQKLMINPGDNKLLSWPETKDDPILAPNIAGYVEPSKTYFDIASVELAELENAMNYTVWGASTAHKAQGPTGVNASDGQKTATQVIDDMQPKIDRLYPISEAAEKRHKFVIDLLITHNMKQTKYWDVKGSSINYGRRYLLETPDIIWTRYSDARAKGASVSILDGLLREYIETKYVGDPISLAIQTKLMALEPFVHLTIAQAEPLIELELDYVKKLYFGQWVNSLRKNELLVMNEVQLEDLLTTYATDMLEQIKADRDAQAVALANQQKNTQDITGVKHGNTIQKETV